jgi:desulfoferrodoxin (superoxide reductase-like protein)
MTQVRSYRATPLFGRRSLLLRAVTGVLAVAGLTSGFPAWVFGKTASPTLHRPKDPENLTEFERLHVPRVRIAEVIEDGANAPVIVEMDHPMDQDHYIQNVRILDYQDPLIWKGTFHFTPDSGAVFLYTQVRLDAGKSTIYAVAECNQHGRWVGSADVDVAVGGC